MSKLVRSNLTRTLLSSLPPPLAGRVAISDHGAFVLINVYVPNAGDRPARARLGFKLSFLEALKRKTDALRKEGREVRVLGGGCWLGWGKGDVVNAFGNRSD